MGKSEAWEWVTVLIAKTHPDVQCNYCGTVIRNCQLGRDLLRHASSKCPDAPEEIVASALALTTTAAVLKATRRQSGAAAHKRRGGFFKRMAWFDDSEDEEEDRKRRYWEGKQRYWDMLAKMEKENAEPSS